MVAAPAFVVGDVHGCIDELEDLLRVAGWTRLNPLVFVGDLVAKGPDSQAVVQLAREAGATATLGNHDRHVLRARRGQPVKPTHVAAAASLREAEWRFLEAMPLWHRLDAFGSVVVHAGMAPGVPLDAQDPEHLINMRSIDAAGRPTKVLEAGVPWASLHRGPEFVVFGHDAVRGLQRWPFALGLDTGCVYGRRLSGVWLPERRLVQVKARRTYLRIEDA